MIKVSFFLLLALCSFFCLYSCYWAPYSKEFKSHAAKKVKDEEPIAKKSEEHVKVKSRSNKYHQCNK